MSFDLPPPDPDFLKSDDGWPAFRRVLAYLCDFYGEPRDLALAPPLAGDVRRLLSFFLRVLEALARRLLLIEADMLEPLVVTVQGFGAWSERAPKTGAARPRWSEAPGTWRCAPPLSTPLRASAASAQKTCAPRNFLHEGNRGLAYRLEALRRAAQDPALYARRLAARIRALEVLPQMLVIWRDKDFQNKRTIDQRTLVWPAQVQAYRVWWAIKKRMCGGAPIP